MKCRRWVLIIAAAVLALTFCLAMAPQPQLTADEQAAIIESVIQTVNPDGIRATAVAEAEQNIAAKLKAGGYEGMVYALGLSLPESTPAAAEGSSDELTQPTPTMTVDLDSTVDDTAVTAQPTAASTSGRPIDNPEDYWDGAVLQEDGTYRGLHAKQVSSYAYTTGGDSGTEKTFSSEYTPNVRFTVDIVFENDGTVIWPGKLELRHTGNVGEFTGSPEIIYSDHTNDPIKPGGRLSFSIAAYGSECLGPTTFYFQLFNSESGLPIEGGNASFYYLAK